MNGANHGTVDTCGENVNSLNGSLIHARVGERVILGNNSRLLHKELGQQVPIKSRQKMNRDISKFMKNSFGDNFSTTTPPVSGQKPPGQKLPGQKPPLPKTPRTKTPQRKLMNTKYILHK